MSTRFEILPKAQQDYAEAYIYYLDRNEIKAAAFESKILDYFEFIKENPKQFRERNGTRIAVVTNFPYIIRYTTYDDGIQIVAIAHQRRKPDYWKSRITAS